MNSMGYDISKTMVNVLEILERHTDLNHHLMSFCKNQKKTNSIVNLYMITGIIFGIAADFRFTELNREIGELKMEIDRLKCMEGD